MPEQLSLIAAVAERSPSRRRSTPAGWTRLTPIGSKIVQHWRHEASGWEVRHCGHPTALWPYYATDPAHPDRAVVSFNGLGFRSLAITLAVVERVVAGELVVTNSRCSVRTRRVLCTAAGEAR